MSDLQITIGLCSVLVLGIGAQWVAQRLRIPSLLLLLPAGLLAGATGLVDPVGLFGDTLFPLVTLLVALLLFQSGLNLRLEDLPTAARVPVLRLVTIGIVVTFVGGAFAVILTTDLPIQVAWVLGAILTVSGPTVIGPMLKVIRPKPPAGPVLAWEGTLLDPIGATLGVVVVGLVLASARGGDYHPVLEVLSRLGAGAIVGLIGAWVLVTALNKYLVAGGMEAAVAMLVALACFGIAEVMRSEAGLFAAVVLGVVLANQKAVPTHRILGFGETLEVLIIAMLFILLGALVEPQDLIDNVWSILLIVAALVLIVRPVSVAISQFGSSLPRRERILVAWMDPRGVVAAATAAQFTPLLLEENVDSSLMLPIVFGVILGTGVVYGLTAPLLARELKVTLPHPTGVALVGNRAWLFDLGRCLQDSGVRVLMVVGLEAESGTFAHESLPAVPIVEGHEDLGAVLEHTPLASAVVATTQAVAADFVGGQLVEALGRSNVYVAPRTAADERSTSITQWVREPFEAGATLKNLDDRFERGGRVEVFTLAAPSDAITLATIDAAGTVNLRPGRSLESPSLTIAMAGGI